MRRLLAGSRSGHLSTSPIDLESVPGLQDALDALTEGDSAPTLDYGGKDRFDLRRYQTHVQAHAGPIVLELDSIPPLIEDARLDRIWRFIAIIFLAHAGLLHVWQDGAAIMVKQRETDTEGQGVPGELEDADGIEGSVGPAET